MKHKLVQCSYRNRDGIFFKGYFIKSVRGLIPVNIDKDVTVEFYEKLGENDAGDIEIEL